MWIWVAYLFVAWGVFRPSFPSREWRRRIVLLCAYMSICLAPLIFISGKFTYRSLTRHVRSGAQDSSSGMLVNTPSVFRIQVKPCGGWYLPGYRFGMGSADYRRFLMVSKAPATFSNANSRFFHICPVLLLTLWGGFPDVWLIALAHLRVCYR